MLRAGRLNRRVTIKTPQTTTNAYGEEIAGTPLEEDRWVEIKPMSATERLQAGSMEEQTTHRVTMRYKANLAPTQWIEWEGRRLEIQGVTDPGELHEVQELDCKEVT